MYKLFRYAIFQMDAEKAHDFTLQCLKMTTHPLFYPLLNHSLIRRKVCLRQ